MMKHLFVSAIVLAVVAGTAANAALLNHWKFDDLYTAGSTNWTSNSVGPEDGEVRSDVTYNSTGGASGGYMYFQGGSQAASGTAESRIQIDPAAINDLGTSAVTMSFWIRITDAAFSADPGVNRFVPFMAREQANIRILGGYCPLRDTIRKVYFFSGNPDDPSGTQCISDELPRSDYGTGGDWQHFALTADRSTGDMKIYHNGALIKTEPSQTGQMPLSYDWFAMGCSQVSLTTWAESSDFDMDDVQIYDTALSHDQVDWLARHPGSPAPDQIVRVEAGLLNHWKFDDLYTVGTTNWTSNDVGPEDGQVFSEVAYNASGGASGGYMHFNGGQQEPASSTAESRIQVDTAAVNDLGRNAVTLSYWVRITHAEFDQVLNRFCPVFIRANKLANGSEGDDPFLGGYCPLRGATLKVYFFTGDTDHPSGTQLISDELTRGHFGADDGLWQHYAMTADRTSGIIKIYHNGSVIKQGTGLTGPMPYSYNNFPMGCAPGGSETMWSYQSEFDLDDVQMYATALSDSQVAWLTANPGLPIPPDGSLIVIR